MQDHGNSGQVKREIMKGREKMKEQENWNQNLNIQINKCIQILDKFIHRTNMYIIIHLDMIWMMDNS